MKIIVDIVKSLPKLSSILESMIVKYLTAISKYEEQSPSDSKYYKELPKLHWVYEDGSECDYYDKSVVRKSNEWHELKEFVEERQNWKDAITLSPLRKGHVIHHLNLNEDEYGILDSDNFISLNQMTHKMLHFCYEYYKKDPEFLIRLQRYMEIMCELNSSESKVHFARS